MINKTFATIIFCSAFLLLVSIVNLFIPFVPKNISKNEYQLIQKPGIQNESKRLISKIHKNVSEFSETPSEPIHSEEPKISEIKPDSPVETPDCEMDLTLLMNQYYHSLAKPSAMLHKILQAVSGIKSDGLTEAVMDYLQISILENDDQLIAAMAEGLANIDSANSINYLYEMLKSSKSQEESRQIISSKIAEVRNADCIPLLKAIIQERLTDYDNAMAAMLQMGNAGIESLFFLIENDPDGELEESLLQIVHRIEYDEEIYASIEKMNHQSKYQNILDSLNDIHKEQ
ncbi:secreted protein [Candidatus Magnetomorum sp. HK-1]|nr:secreted protein [Candidatus Magnetomorum sp. HK-1]